MSIKINVAGFSVKGEKREQNEDSYYWNSNQGLFIVCDGMGGIAGGDIASYKVIEMIIDRNLEPQDNLEQNIEQVRCCVKRVSQALKEYGESHSKYQGLGTTLSGIWLTEHGAIIMHAGDTRIYRGNDREVEGKRLECLTKDHINHKEGSHVLYKAMGYPQLGEADVWGIPLARKESFFLCSDGLWSTLEQEDIESTMQDKSVSIYDKVESLKQKGCQNRGCDDMTGMMIDFERRSDGEE